MKIDQIKLSRHFFREDGTEETIELTGKPVYGMRVSMHEAIEDMRAELEQYDETGTILEDIRSQTQRARSELSTVIRRLNAAIYRLENMRERLESAGLTNEEITSLIAPIDPETHTD